MFSLRQLEVLNFISLGSLALNQDGTRPQRIDVNTHSSTGAVCRNTHKDVHAQSQSWTLLLSVILVIQRHCRSYLVKMSLRQQHRTHRLGTLVVRGFVVVRVSVPPMGLPPLPSPVSVGASSANLIRSQSAGCSSTHFYCTGTWRRAVNKSRSVTPSLMLC